jgi:hypothetical protein
LVDNHIKVHGMVCFGLDGMSPHPASNLEVDHVVPVALGGTDRDGLRVLCDSCNGSSGARLGNRLPGAKQVRHSRVWWAARPTLLRKRAT